MPTVGGVGPPGPVDTPPAGGLAARRAGQANAADVGPAAGRAAATALSTARRDCARGRCRPRRAAHRRAGAAGRRCSGCRRSSCRWSCRRWSLPSCRCRSCCCRKWRRSSRTSPRRRSQIRETAGGRGPRRQRVVEAGCRDHRDTRRRRSAAGRWQTGAGRARG